MNERCDTCRFGIASDGGPIACHRHAPTQLLQIGVVSGYAFPGMKAEDWCGDWEGQREKSISIAQTVAELEQGRYGAGETR